MFTFFCISLVWILGTIILDGDAPGRAAAAELRAEFERRGYRVTTLAPAHGKDWNEYLQRRRPSEKQIVS